MIKNLFRSQFIRHVIIVASGTASAQVITMAFSPLITRLYGPETFGVLGTFTAILGLIMPIAAMSYPIAIVLPKSDDDAKALAKLSFRVALFITLFLIFILLFIPEQILTTLGIKSISNYILLIPIALFFDALQQIMQQWLIRKKQFKVIARIAISQSIILNSLKVSIGYFYPFGVVLIILTTLGNALYAIQLFLGAKKWTTNNEIMDKPPNKISLKYIAFRYKDFALYRTPQVLLNAFSQSLPILMLASFFGPATAGFFALGKGVLSAPASLIGNSVGNVFYPKIVESINHGESPLKLLNKATAAAFFIGVIPFSAIIIFGKFIFSFIFGSEWLISGQYAQWMALWVLFSLASRPLIATIPAIHMQGFFLIYEIIFLALKIISLVIGCYFYNNPLLAVALYSITTACSYITLYISILFSLHSKEKNII